MKMNLRWEYGRRLYSNVKLFALIATVIFGILLAFKSPAPDGTDTDVDTEVIIEDITA